MGLKLEQVVKEPEVVYFGLAMSQQLVRLESVSPVLAMLQELERQELEEA